MSLANWAILVGGILVAMTLAGTLLARLPLSAAIVYLGIGWALGPRGIGALDPDPIKYAALLEPVAQAGLLVSLFSIGLRLEVPLRDRRWRIPLRLAFPSMVVSVMLVAAVGVVALHLSLGLAVLLGAILAPTDPVLASGIQPASGESPDPLRFSLAGEGALNDGTAFPFVLLGFGLLGEGDLMAASWHWWTVDLVWSMTGGGLVGFAVGGAIGTLVSFLRQRHREALGLNEFLALGIVGLAFGLAQLVHASGFLAVFAAGLALRRIPLSATGTSMKDSVLLFNEQVGKLAEPVLVIATGAMLAYVDLSLELFWFSLAVLAAVRPISVWLGLLGSEVPQRQRALMGWFGIRGIGSVYYLLFAMTHGIPGSAAPQFVSLTLAVVAASIVLHGVTATPLMRSYGGYSDR